MQFPQLQHQRQLSPKILDREQLEFEKIIADVSFKFVNVIEDELAAAIGGGLCAFCEHFAIDRGSYFRVDADGLLFHSVSWTAPGLVSEHWPLPAAQHFPWTVEQILAGEPVAFTSLDSIPGPIDRTSFRELGSRSALFLPLRVDGRVTGAVGFSMLSTEREWTPDLRRRLDVGAALFTQALARQQRDEALRAASVEVQTLKRQLQGPSPRREGRNGRSVAVGQGPALRRVLDSSVNIAWNEIRHRARLVKDYGDTPMVESNESRLGQVFLNLLLNAAHAIPEGETERNEIRVSTRTDGRGYAVVEIRDTGVGIPPEIRDRIFDPFFTTKPAGEGTGLGLWICSGILSALGGEITVDSDKGKGSVFRVALPPVAMEAPSMAAARAPVDAGAPGGRLLIVDDEPMILGALRRSFSSDYHVTCVGDGRRALERIRAGERYDAILCDLMMPEITGMDLYAEMSRIAPEQIERMVFVTGGAFTPRAREFLENIPNARVEKPIDFQNLKLLLRNLRR